MHPQLHCGSWTLPCRPPLSGSRHGPSQTHDAVVRRWLPAGQVFGIQGANAKSPALKRPGIFGPSSGGSACEGRSRCAIERRGKKNQDRTASTSRKAIPRCSAHLAGHPQPEASGPRQPSRHALFACEAARIHPQWQPTQRLPHRMRNGIPLYSFFLHNCLRSAWCEDSQGPDCAHLPSRIAIDL